jgi:hypothetical protein
VTRRSISRPVSIAGAIAAFAALTGCGGGGLLGRDTLIRNNPTPELETLDLRDVDQDNRWAIMANENLRMLQEDWDRLWYTDRASRLTRYPMR